MAYLPLLWAGTLLPENQQASLQPPSVQFRHQAADPPKQHKPRTSSTSRVTVAQLNRWYEKGHPSNQVESAGLLVHAHDNTERVGVGKLAFPSGAQFNQFWATSLVNSEMPALYQYNCGIVLDPKYVQLLCSVYMDFTSWNDGCNRTNLAQLLPGNTWARDTPFPPAMFENMLNASLGLQNGGYRYNEVLVNSTAYRENLPGSVAGVFYVHRADDPGDPECAFAAHSALVELYGLKPEDVLLLRHTPRATPAFVMHAEAAKKDEKQARETAKEGEKQEEAAAGDISCKVLAPGLTDAWCVAACVAAASCPREICECNATLPKFLRQRRPQREWRDFWWSALTAGHNHTRGNV